MTANRSGSAMARAALHRATRPTSTALPRSLIPFPGVGGHTNRCGRRFSCRTAATARVRLRDKCNARAGGAAPSPPFGNARRSPCGTRACVSSLSL